MGTYRLVVDVIKAQVVVSLFSPGPVNTCVELVFGRQQYHTSVKENDVNPVWNERFFFDVSDPSNLPTLALEAHVFRVQPRSNTSKSFLGMVKIDGAKVPSRSHCHQLGPGPGSILTCSGKLCLEVYVDSGAGASSYYSILLTSFPRLRTVSVQEEEGRQSIIPSAIPLSRLEEITDNFSTERILGQGGFGVVYKGVLPDEKMMAVKKFNKSPWISSVEKSFEKEVLHPMMLIHRNIVRVVGYCYEIRKNALQYNGKYVFAENTEMILCLEYIPNKSLDKHLSDESSGFEWRTRYNIIKGICNGLRHLHENDIIHMDLKPANILLDDGLVPKIADFGLSRLLDQQQTINTANRIGTLGYMAPEFIHEGTITRKSDIFSLGVIILEVVTGHRDYRTDCYVEDTLEKWRNVLWRSPGYGALESECKEIERCIKVGLDCVNPERTKRPSISEVINRLQGLVPSILTLLTGRRDGPARSLLSNKPVS